MYAVLLSHTQAQARIDKERNAIEMAEAVEVAEAHAQEWWDSKWGKVNDDLAKREMKSKLLHRQNSLRVCVGS